MWDTLEEKVNAMQGEGNMGRARKTALERANVYCPICSRIQNKLLGRRFLTLHQCVTNNCLQWFALALITLLLLGWRWLCFLDDDVLVSGSDFWDTDVLTQSATAQSVAVDDTDGYAKGIPHFSPLETILKSSSLMGHQILNCFISLLHLSSFNFYLPFHSHFILFYFLHLLPIIFPPMLLCFCPCHLLS